MYKRISAILFPVATLLLIGAMVWGYQENQEKNAILIKAENQYQRAFHDLSYHVEKLHQELGNTLAVHSSSTGAQRKGLVNVWRITSSAQNEINQLPLTLLPFNKTEEFLSRISKFSYQTAVRDLTKQPLTDGEMKNLKELYKNAEQISKDLQQVQTKVIGDRLRWMDVETALASQKEPLDNTIIDGFKTVDKKVGEYPELDWGPSISSMYSKRSVKKIGGKPTTTETVTKKAAAFTGRSESEVKVTENGQGTEWASFTASITSQQNKAESWSIDFTKNGGHVISYFHHRDIGSKQASSSEARKQADQFLSDKQYNDMTPVTYDEYDNMGTFTYVSKKGDVLIYPEKITIRVALDNGEVIGMQASDYVYERESQSEIGRPVLSVEQARKYLNSDFKVKYHRLAWIENDSFEKVLTYEFGGTINNSNYKIFINSNDGNEESIERVHDPNMLNKAI